MMTNGINFGYSSGQKLSFSAYLQNGSGRGMENQPLNEIRANYYFGMPMVDLVAGDVVIARVVDSVVSSSNKVYSLYYDSIYSNGNRVYSNDRWVITKDSQSLQPVVTTGEAIGAGEYRPEVTTPEILIDLSSLITGQTKYVGTGAVTRIGIGGGGGAVSIPFGKPEDE